MIFLFIEVIIIVKFLTIIKLIIDRFFGLCKMNNGLIISYSGDNNNQNKIKIWFL